MTGSNRPSRRQFLGTSTAAAAGAMAAAGWVPAVHAQGSDAIKVGLIGCGGRGSGAAENICEAAGTTYNIKLHALADIFQDRLEQCAGRLETNAKCEGKFDVPAERRFLGFDAYQKAIECCDLVMLATPPGFRPLHIAAAVKAGRNVFCEKPVAVDGPGIRKVLAAHDEAKSQGLAAVAGTQRRHQSGYIESLKRIHDGEIGPLVTARVFWNTGSIWAKKREEGWSDVEYQLRNWYHFVWLCGDHINEQHVHNLDVANWALQAHPISCVGMGGQQVNREPEYGESFDHFAVDYAYPDGQHVLSMCRQTANAQRDVSEYLVGTKGMAHLRPGTYDFNGQTDTRRRNRDEVNPYVQEHIDLLESIQSGKPINELKQVAESTLTAIMGRLSAYTGQEVTWEQALNSQLDTFPKELSWDSKLPEPKVAMPGITELI